ncbi:YciI family protein [Microbulbifer sp. OS29]|uniref:YciI family protein n=1 Tax=Microbulbifer okhotskensis TaxID=2926617 RepID=A0A9X2EPL2_9GAMM|nr:YciI family protein [Microbulbifer okhotskensis]MCO1335410.1 YciI family protein [Microbulbifer okhotskensis]
MFLVDLHFTDMEKLTPELTAEHRGYLEGEYRSGSLLFGGRKAPRTGGIIISRHSCEQALRRLLDEDPFVKNGISTYSITEFVPVVASEKFSDLLLEP